MHLLIDADSAVYKAGLSNESRSYLVTDIEATPIAEFKYKKQLDAWKEVIGEEKWEGEGYRISKNREVGPVEYSLANVKRIVKQMTEWGAPDPVSWQLYIQGDNNFRNDIYDAYKANRDPDDKPVHLKEIRQYLVDKWGAIIVDGEETDDRVSILQCTMETDTCIVSIDKDLLNTPGWHYNYDSELYRFIDPAQAMLNFARQMLTGDSTDNIPGLKRVGKKTAEKILPKYREDWLDVVLKEYEKQGLGPATAERNGQLLWMRRKENEMWSLDYE